MLVYQRVICIIPIFGSHFYPIPPSVPSSRAGGCKALRSTEKTLAEIALGALGESLAGCVQGKHIIIHIYIYIYIYKSYISYIYIIYIYKSYISYIYKSYISYIYIIYIYKSYISYIYIIYIIHTYTYIYMKEMEWTILKNHNTRFFSWMVPHGMAICLH